MKLGLVCWVWLFNLLSEDTWTTGSWVVAWIGGNGGATIGLIVGIVDIGDGNDERCDVGLSDDIPLLIDAATPLILSLDMVDCIPCLGVGGRGGILTGIFPLNPLSKVKGAHELLLILVAPVAVFVDGLAKLNFT